MDKAPQLEIIPSDRDQVAIVRLFLEKLELLTDAERQNVSRLIHLWANPAWVMTKGRPE